MPIENKFTRCEDPADPNRCQGVTRSGQCPYMRMENSNFCPMHGGNKGQQKVEKENIRKYNIAKYQARIIQFADHPGLKSLKEEVAMLSVLLEDIWNRCQGPDDLLLYGNKITDYIDRIQRVVVACHKLEQSSGQVLDKSAALNFAAKVVDIIADNIPDPEIVDNISNGILMALTEMQGVPIDGSSSD